LKKGKGKSDRGGGGGETRNLGSVGPLKTAESKGKILTKSAQTSSCSEPDILTYVDVLNSIRSACRPTPKAFGVRGTLKKFPAPPGDEKGYGRRG